MRKTPPLPTGSATVNLEVGTPAWSHLKRRFALTEDARRFREHLGIPTDRPIIMTGHQAEWWHPGILAKLLSARAIADRVGGVVVWLVVDQDDNDPGSIQIPVIADGSKLATIEHRLAPPSHRATGWREPIDPAPVPPGMPIAAPSVRAGLERMFELMRARSTEKSAARQLGAATMDALAGIVGPDSVVYASDLARTDAMAELVARMIADPRGCVEAYNAPAARLGDEHVRPLGAEPDHKRWELPLWSIDATGARTHVWSDSAHPATSRSVMPRALTMTALVRLHGCELFIHGTGGAAYDAMTDRWIRSWLAHPLAPTALATADVRVRFDTSGIDELTVREITEKAHRARHDPAILGDRELRDQKDSLVAAIAATRARGESASAGYRAMQDLLAAYRDAHKAELDGLRAAATVAGSTYRASRETVMSRTWPFPYYPRPQLDDLASRISIAVAESNDRATTRS